jgi:filamin
MGASPDPHRRTDPGARPRMMTPSSPPPPDNDDDDATNQTVPRDDRHWVSIQRSTFTNWIRDRLADDDEETANVVDLQTDLRDGWRLCRLVEALQHRRVAGHAVRRPINRHQRIDNINLALQAMVDDGIKLINIGRKHAPLPPARVCAPTGVRHVTFSM